MLTKYLGVEAVDFQQTLDEALAFGDYVEPMKSDVAGLLHELRKQGKKILFEGAQGSLLDIDHGTYPYVTSSNTTVGGALAGTGVGADAIDYVLGIAKAYATRVGGGPFPTELDDEIGQALRDRGTGIRRDDRPSAPLRLDRHRRAQARGGDQRHHRPVHHQARRARRHATSSRSASPTNTAASAREYAPLDAAGWDECKPVYLEFPGWQESTHGITSWDELPPAARAYLRALEELAGCPLAIVSTGPDRDANIVLRDPFA